MSLEKFKQAKKSITEDFEIIEKLVDNGVKGQLKIDYDFTNEIEYNRVLNYFYSKYEAYKHNFQLGDGLSVMLIWDNY